MDISEPLDADMTSYYQYIIGIARWMIELGCVDIATEVSMLSSNNDYPREGNFEAVLNIMSYLKGRHNLCLSLDPS